MKTETVIDMNEFVRLNNRLRSLGVGDGERAAYRAVFFAMRSAESRLRRAKESVGSQRELLRAEVTGIVAEVAEDERCIDHLRQEIGVLRATMATISSMQIR